MVRKKAGTFVEPTMSAEMVSEKISALKTKQTVAQAAQTLHTITKNLIQEYRKSSDKPSFLKEYTSFRYQ